MYTLHSIKNINICVCVFFHLLVSVAVVLESLAAQCVAVVKHVPESWMVKRPDREESLML